MKQPPLTLCRLFSSTLILLFWVLLWNTSLTHKFRTRRTHKATAPAFHKCSFLKNLFIYFQREGKGGRKEGNKHQCEGETPVSWLLFASNQGHGPKPRHVPWVGIKPQPFSSQAGAQSTGQHQPGHKCSFALNALVPSSRWWAGMHRAGAGTGQHPRTHLIKSSSNNNSHLLNTSYMLGPLGIHTCI